MAEVCLREGLASRGANVQPEGTELSRCWQASLRPDMNVSRGESSGFGVGSRESPHPLMLPYLGSPAGAPRGVCGAEEAGAGLPLREDFLMIRTYSQI